MVERNLAKVEVESSRLFSRSSASWRQYSKMAVAENRSSNAGVAQLVERNLAKVEVESSRLFSRSSFQGVPEGHSSSSSGEVAKRLCSGLQSRLDGFDSRPRLQMKKMAHFRVGYFFVCPFARLCPLCILYNASKLNRAAWRL